MALDKTADFWDWFASNQSYLVPDKITNELVAQLDAKILSLGDFGWEIREGKDKDNMLIISPSGNPELLKTTKGIIDKAPHLPVWEFCHYKPAKDWDFKLSVEEGANIKRMIDVSEWQYVLLKFPDGTYDMLLKAGNIGKLPDNEKNVMADIVLESILGEKLSLELIKNIEFVDDFSEEYQSKKTSVRHLKDHIFDMEAIS